MPFWQPLKAIDCSADVPCTFAAFVNYRIERTFKTCVVELLH